MTRSEFMRLVIVSWFSVVISVGLSYLAKPVVFIVVFIIALMAALFLIVQIIAFFA